VDTIVVEREAGVVTVTLNRPERKNALTEQMAGELVETFVAVSADPDDRVLVLTGAGGAFCSGADIGGDGVAPGTEPPHRPHRLRNMQRAALALHEVGKPTIAKVRGVAVGAGANFALGCDLVLAGEDARFSQIFVHRGLTIDYGGSWLLPRLVGLRTAKELAFFGDMVGAADALELGLVNRVVPDAELDELVTDWATRLAAGPPLALSMTKRLLDQGVEMSMAEAIDNESHAQTLCFTTKDAREAITAFREKRDPEFRGR
jgi:2-(1,2-epoxy-1,2-dihydrophenyl)acetyl-CoA isomerase